MKAFLNRVFNLLLDKVPLGVKPLAGPKPNDGNEKRRIILVHGLHGDEQTWLNMPDHLIENIENSAVYLYSYASGFKRYTRYASMSPADDAKVLADYLRDDPYTGNYILCGHSEGGIIIALALKLLHERENMETLKRIIGQFLFNSPMAGSTWANPFQIIPFINNDLRVLKMGSKELIDLSRYFTRHFDFNEGNQNKKLCHIPTWAICATGDKYVTQFSAAFGVPENQVRLIHGDHFSIVKPENDLDCTLNHVIHTINKLLKACNESGGSVSPDSATGTHPIIMYDLESDQGIEQLISDCKDAHSRGEYASYYNILKRFSLPLKKKGRHRELSQVCELDVYRKDSANLYPTLGYSQSELVMFNLRSAFDALNHRLENDSKLESWSPLTRLRFAQTYCEILNANGTYDVAAGILEAFLSYRSIEEVKFKALSQTLGVLGRSYLGKGDIESALDLFSATLDEQNLTADKYGIAIAEMNLGIAYMHNGNYIVAKNMFSGAMETFRDYDVRAFAWAQLNLAIAVKKSGSSENIEELVSSASEYYSDHSECSRDYLTILEYLIKMNNFESSVKKRIVSEYGRISSVIDKNKLSDEQIITSKKAMAVFALCLRSSSGASAIERTVTGGGFKARTLLVKSFKKSLDTDRAVEYLKTIKSKANHFSVPFYNDFLVEVCKRRKDLIEIQVIQEIENILQQSDSVKLFYAKFLESEGLLSECEKILDNVHNNESYEYLNMRGNLYSHRAKVFNKSMVMYRKAIDATEVEHFRAVVYNNMAHTIYRHHKRNLYELAIDHCKQSIKLRASVRFGYPSVLLLALRIELANLGELSDLVEQHRNEYGLNDYDAKEVSERLYDKTKKKKFRKLMQLI
ncbi:MAG: alpha/beta hydrolase [Thermodesulfovibrionales bacterium]